MPKSQDRWTRIALYYAIALAGAFAFRAYSQTMPVPTNRDNVWLFALGQLEGIGPFIGAIVVALAFKPARILTLWGPHRGLVMATCIWMVLVIGSVGIANPYAINPHLFGAMSAIDILVYAMLEEAGWRGYLQGEFGDWPRMRRYVVVGALWYAWHLTFLDHNGLGSELLRLAVLVGASIGIGLVADRTGAIMAAAGCHALGNILWFSSEFRTLVSSGDRQLMAAVCAVGIAAAFVAIRARDRREAARRIPRAG